MQHAHTLIPRHVHLSTSVDVSRALKCFAADGACLGRTCIEQQVQTYIMLILL